MSEIKNKMKKLKVVSETELYVYIANHAAALLVELVHIIYKHAKMTMRTTKRYLTTSCSKNDSPKNHLLLVVLVVWSYQTSYCKNGPKSGSHETYTTSIRKNIYKLTSTECIVD